MKTQNNKITDLVNGIIISIGLDRNDLDELYNSQSIDEEDDTLDAFIRNHEWLFIPTKGVYIQKEELDWTESRNDVKDYILNNLVGTPIKKVYSGEVFDPIAYIASLKNNK